MSHKTAVSDKATYMIPRIIHQTAPTSNLTWEERALRRRISRLLPDWDARLWTDKDNRQIVAAHFPQHLRAYDAIMRGVVKADIARLVYMHVFGGFYLDTDYKLLRPFDDELRSCTCILPIERGELGNSSFRLGNAVFASEAAHPFWRDFINFIFESNIPNAKSGALAAGPAIDHVVAVAGPLALTRFYVAHRARYSGITLPEIIEFHPNQINKRDRSTYGIHLCWGSWRGKKSVKWLKNQVRRKLSVI